MKRSDIKPSGRGRGRPAVARTARLDRAEILAQAHEIVRADGLDALNMRRLADELGVTPMAIYHHVENKKALLFALVNDVWRQVNEQFPPPGDDLEEWLVQSALATRRVWLDHIALVNLSMAVAPADTALILNAQAMALALEQVGFPNVPLAATALQNFLLGSIATWANRHVASAYFERDPDAVLAEAERLLDEFDATPSHRGVLEGRFDPGDEANFEPALRALVRGLKSEPAPAEPASRKRAPAKKQARKPATAKAAAKKKRSAPKP